jgi:hypothetical protein
MSFPGGYAKVRMMPGSRAVSPTRMPPTRGGPEFVHEAPIANIHIAVPDKKYRFTVGMAQQHGPVGNGRDLNLLREVEARRILYFPGSFHSPVISRN